MDISRRQLLRRAGAIGATAPFVPFAMNLAAFGQASAATASDYKALVCVFLYGGNDAYNTVLATDSASWSAYSTARNLGISPVALPAVGAAVQKASTNFNSTLGGVLPITPKTAQSGRTFALHPLMGGMRELFAAGRLGIVANVGPLVKPTTKADYVNTGFPKPLKLFSHNDQQSTWQTLGVEGTTTGWGGRMMDSLISSNGQPTFSAISVNGNAPFLSGDTARMYELATSGSIHIGGNGQTYGSSVVQQQLLQLARVSRDANLLERDHAATVGRSIDADKILSAALPSTGVWGTSGLASGAVDPLLVYTNPTTGLAELNPLAQELQAVARMISARGSLGMSRQVFFVGLDGFDMHDSLATRHAVGLARLSHAMSYFDAALTGMGVNQNVTTFTTSDFGRAFESNGDGTDHGWGNHHFVMGGAVKGGDIYGTFPTYGVSDGNGGFTSPDQLAAGALLPSTSVDQYAATMGAWFGVSSSQLLTVLPNLANWSSGARNLGFMSA